MSATILYWSLTAAQVMLSIAMALALLRMVFGPRAQDRVLGLDALYLNSMLLLLVFGIGSARTIYFEAALIIGLLVFGIGSARTIYFEAALIIGLLGFVSTMALAKFLMRGEVIE